MSKEVRKTVVVATNEELERTSYRNRLKMAVRNTGFSHREWPTHVQDGMLHAYLKKIDLRYASGKVFDISLVDDVWRNERYIREFLKSEDCKYPEKDRLVDLYFRIMHPDIARHFGR